MELGHVFLQLLSPAELRGALLALDFKTFTVSSLRVLGPTRRRQELFTAILTLVRLLAGVASSVVHDGHFRHQFHTTNVTFEFPLPCMDYAVFS